MKVNLAEINKRIEAGLIRKQTLDDLIIVNYSTKCQYDRAWDEYTQICRGLIIRADGTVHAKSFKKFYNLGEAPGPSLAELPQEDPVVTLKLDGYLGISYVHGGKVKIASRGSFTSEYAQWATEWLHKNNPDAALNPGDCEPYTFVFEILYPHRRIVVDHKGHYGLVLLTVVETETGLELPRKEIEGIGQLYRWPVVQSYPTHTIGQCTELAKTLKGTEQEGFVAYYPKSGIRVKIKGEDYSKIHRLVTSLTTRRIWEIYASNNGKVAIADEKIQELCGILPDDYASWTKKTANDMKVAMARMFSRAYWAATEAVRKNLPQDASRKDIVGYLQQNYADVWHEALYFYDKKVDNGVSSIWNRLKPVHETPLVKNGEDE